MDCIEYFFESYQYTFSAIGALATAFAVYLALRKRKPKIEVELNIDTKYRLIAPDDQPQYNFICAEIINLDSMPIEIQINSFRSKRKQIIHPIDYIDNSGYPHPLEDIGHYFYTDNKGNSDRWEPLAEDLKQYPFLIKAGESKKFYLFFEKEFIEKFSKAGVLKRILIKMNLFCLFYKPRIVIYNKFIYRASLGRELKNKIKKVIKSKS